MAVNVLNFNQVSTLLAEIVQQASGQKTIAPIDTNEFVTVGQTALLSGTDNIISAISQVLSRTIFSVRPYNAKFKGMRVTAEKFGAITRKLVSVDNALEDDDRFSLVDGSSVDMYIVKKPTVLQLNFYGFNVYQQSVTIFRDQLNTAFEGPSQFGEFISMVMTNISDQMEQADEELSRQCINNMIGGIIADNDANRAINALTLFNTETGSSATLQTIFTPAVFPAFARWFYGLVERMSKKFEIRSTLYHQNITSKTVMRHTPKADQRLYVSSDVMSRVKAEVLADVYNPFLLSLGDYEEVPYWQNLQSPMDISVEPVHLDPAGTLTTETTAVTGKVLGILADVEAFGTVNMNEWMAPTPFNARGGYHNIFWHQEKKYWNDFTENAVVFYLA